MALTGRNKNRTDALNRPSATTATLFIELAALIVPQSNREAFAILKLSK